MANTKTRRSLLKLLAGSVAASAFCQYGRAQTAGDIIPVLDRQVRAMLAANGALSAVQAGQPKAAARIIAGNMRQQHAVNMERLGIGPSVRRRPLEQRKDAAAVWARQPGAATFPVALVRMPASALLDPVGIVDENFLSVFTNAAVWAASANNVTSPPLVQPNQMQADMAADLNTFASYYAGQRISGVRYQPSVPGAILKVLGLVTTANDFTAAPASIIQCAYVQGNASNIKLDGICANTVVAGGTTGYQNTGRLSNISGEGLTANLFWILSDVTDLDLSAAVVTGSPNAANQAGSNASGIAVLSDGVKLSLVNLTKATASSFILADNVTIDQCNMVLFSTAALLAGEGSGFTNSMFAGGNIPESLLFSKDQSGNVTAGASIADSYVLGMQSPDTGQPWSRDFTEWLSSQGNITNAQGLINRLQNMQISSDGLITMPGSGPDYLSTLALTAAILLDVGGVQQTLMQRGAMSRKNVADLLNVANAVFSEMQGWLGNQIEVWATPAAVPQPPVPQQPAAQRQATNLQFSVAAP